REQARLERRRPQRRTRDRRALGRLAVGLVERKHAEQFSEFRAKRALPRFGFLTRLRLEAQQPRRCGVEVADVQNRIEAPAIESRLDACQWSDVRRRSWLRSCWNLAPPHGA